MNSRKHSSIPRCYSDTMFGAASWLPSGSGVLVEDCAASRVHPLYDEVVQHHLALGSFHNLLLHTVLGHQAVHRNLQTHNTKPHSHIVSLYSITSVNRHPMVPGKYADQEGVPDKRLV